MKLFINGKFLTQERSGVQYFASGIVKELLQLYPDITILAPSNTINTSLTYKKTGFFKGVLWEQVSIPIYLYNQKNYILLNLCNSAPLLIRNNVITIHDLAFEQKNKHWFKKNFKRWYQFLIPKLVQRAILLFTVSEFSKRELIDHYLVDKERIKVIPNGIDISESVIQTERKNKYLLLIGSNNPRKNSAWIVANIELIVKNGYELILIENNDPIFENIEQDPHSKITVKKHVSDVEYISLLKNASALLYPSEYEGFGIPILESICYGVPVIASDLNVFHESFGLLPIYFKLNDIESFEKAIKLIDKHQITESDIKELKNKYDFKRSANLVVNYLNELKR